MFAGFTNTGQPSSVSTRPARVSSTAASRTARWRTMGRPAAAATVLAMALSMLSADPSTPVPT